MAGRKKSTADRPGGPVKSSNSPSVGGFSERAAKWNFELPERLDLQLGPGGRVVIPAAFRKAMGVREGDRLMAWVVDGELRVITPQKSIERAQKLVRESIPADVDLIETLMEMRRNEVEDEMRNG